VAQHRQAEQRQLIAPQPEAEGNRQLVALGRQKRQVNTYIFEVLDKYLETGAQREVAYYPPPVADATGTAV